MEYKVLHGDYYPDGKRYSYIFCTLEGFEKDNITRENIWNIRKDYTITLVADWRKNNCEIHISKFHNGVPNFIKEFKTIDEAEPIIDDEFVKKYLEEVIKENEQNADRLIK